MAKRKNRSYKRFPMHVLPLLLLAVLESSDLASAINASDVGAVMRLWSDDAPSRNADRKRVVRIMNERLRAATSVEANAIRLELRDGAGTLVELYTLPLDAAGRVQTMTPVTGGDGTLGHARELLHRGADQLERGDFADARQSLTRSIEIADELGHAPTRSWARRGLGMVLVTAGEGPAAVALFEEAKAIAEAAGDRRSVARSLDRLAHADRLMGQHARGRERLEESLRIYQELGDRLSPAYVQLGLGTLESIQGRQREARVHGEAALRVLEAAGDVDGTSTALNLLGITHRRQGRYAESADYLTRSLELSRRIDDLEGVAYALGNLGVTLASQGKLTEALQAYDQALALNARLGRADGQMRMLNNVGEMYRMLGNYPQARQHFEQSYALAQQTQFQPNLAMSLQNLASVQRDEGDYTGAIATFRKALPLAEALGDTNLTAMILHNMAVSYFSNGDRTGALKLFERVLKIAESMDDHESMSVSLGMLGELTPDKDEAIAYSRRSLELSLKMGLPERTWNSHLGLGRSYRRAGNRVEAMEQVEQAIAIIEELRRSVPGDETSQQQAFELMVRPYHEMVGLLVEQNDLAGALDYAERAKARALLDVLRNGRPELGEVLTESERAAEAELAAELSELNRRYREALVAGRATTEQAGELRAKRLRYDAFLTSLYGAHPQLRFEAGEIAPLRTSDVAALLEGGAADVLLEFVVTFERTYLFTMRRGGALRVRTIEISRDELQKEVRRFRQLLANRDVTYGPASLALYERLLGDSAQDLRGAKTIAIVADGPLWELPFQALQPKAGEFLLDRHALYYVPSLTVLREMSARRAPQSRASSLLAIGNPLLPKKGVAQFRGDAALPPLPQTEDEIRGIAPLYDNKRVHLRGDAREDVVKSEARTFDVLHFATHAVLDDHNALSSRLVLSPSGEREDGLLEAREIMRLDLNADMAVLSACETARGRIGEGEGLIGMSWALFVAGVPTSVVSQWKVDSQSTSELMIDFHRTLRGGARSKAEALRAAALKTKARAAYRHPFYWAPFVVVGSAR